jgi:hypothetical protein
VVLRLTVKLKRPPTEDGKTQKYGKPHEGGDDHRQA